MAAVAAARVVVGKRRSPDHVRGLILEAARTLFSSGGYVATTTRQIAESASVTEKALYRHFGTKACLFEAAMLAPLTEFIEAYHEAWTNFPDDLPPEQRLRPFIQGFFPLVRQHRDMLLSLMTIRATEGTTATSVAREFTDAIRGLHDVARSEFEERSWIGADPAVTIAASAGMVISLVLHEDLLLPGQTDADRARLPEEITNLIIHGVAHQSHADVGR
jgi:AcrR family transcriptional regulator